MKIKASKFLAVLCTLAMMVATLVPMLTLSATAAEESETISFADTTQRVSQDSNSQVWQNGDVTFTNNKASSSTPVANYSNPVRVYAKSEIIFSAPGNITKIVVEAGSTTYANALQNSVGSEAAVSSSTVTITPSAASSTYTVASLTGQVRIKSLTVYYTAAGDASCAHTNTTTETTPATKTEDGIEIVKCADCGYKISETVLPASGCDVSFVVPEGVEAPEALNGVLKATMPTATLPEGNYAQEYVFAGWAEVSVNADTNERPTLYPAGTTVTLKDDTTFHAVYSYDVSTGEGATESGWILSETINAGDTVVIVGTHSNGTKYAMSNNNGTGSAPSAVEITVAGDKINGTVADTIKWDIGGTAGAYIFYVSGGTSSWLYCTSTNNGVRVGTNAANTFKVDSTTGYLVHNGTSRYLGVYATTPDWRCYTSHTTGNIANQTFDFYVLTEGGIETYYTSVPSTSECDHADAEVVTVDPTCTENGSITTTCSCGYSTIVTIDALGHDWDEGSTTTQPDCTTAGEKTYNCNNGCGETKIEALDALGHNFVDGVCDECGEELQIPEFGEYVFADYAAGTQYAENESHKLDDLLTIVTNKCHFTSELRIYSSSTNDGNAILQSVVPMWGLSLNAGNKVDTVNVYGLENGEWVLIAAVAVTSTSYNDYTVDFGGESYTQIKLDVAGESQVRIKSITVQYAAPVVETPAGEITNASLELGTDLSFIFKATLAEGEDIANFTMSFTLNGKTVSGVTSTDGVFTINGIAPHMMGDTVTATLYKNGEAVDTIDYSIATYLNTVISGDQFTANDKALAEALLIYGAAAQKHQNYNTGALVTENTPVVEDSDKPESVLGTEQNAEKIDGLSFTSVGVNFDYVNRLYVTFNNTANVENVTVEVNGKEAEIVDGRVLTDAIAPANFDATYTFVLYVDGEAYQTVTYSVNSYISAKWNTTDLAKALYNYAAAVADYK